TAISLAGVDAATIQGNRISGGTGVEAQSTGALTIHGNTLLVAEHGTGVRLEAGDPAETAMVTNNIFDGGEYGVLLTGDPAADAEADITVRGNVFLRQEGAAIHADQALPASLDATLGLSLPLNTYGTIFGENANGPAKAVDLTFSSSGDDLLAGGAGDDVLDGTAGNDIIRGGGGNDTLTGG